MIVFCSQQTGINSYFQGLQDKRFSTQSKMDAANLSLTTHHGKILQDFVPNVIFLYIQKGLSTIEGTY